MSWDEKFSDPILLPKGKKLITLRDAALYITKLPKAEYDAEEWQAALRKHAGRRVGAGAQRQCSGNAIRPRMTAARRFSQTGRRVSLSEYRWRWPARRSA
jgi:hypothetical protein